MDIGTQLDAGEWTGYQKMMVALVAATIIFDGADVQVLGIAIPTIMREWAAPRAVFAPVLAGGMFGMMIGGALAGYFGDRMGRKVALLASVAMFGVLTVAAAFAGTPTSLGVLRFLAGLGLGGAMPNAAALASELVPKRHRAFAVTFAIVCVPLGAMLAAAFAEVLLPALGWRGLFMIGGLVPLAVAVVFLFALPESPRYLVRHRARWPELAAFMRRAGHVVTPGEAFTDSTEAPARVAIGALFQPAFRRDTLALWVSFFACLLAVYTAFNWVPALLAGAGLGAYSSQGILAFNLGGVAGAIGGAVIIERVGSRPTMLAMSAAAAVSAVVLSRMPIVAGAAPGPLIAMLTVSGCLINAVQTTMYALAAHVYPSTVRATGVGTAVAVGRSGGVLSTYAGEWAIALGGSAAFFGLIAAAMTVVLAALAVVQRHIEPSSTRSAPDGRANT